MRNVLLPGYRGEVYRTNQGTLLLFMCGAERWAGPWPGMTWDTLYDKYVPLYTQLPSNRGKVPSIWIGPPNNYCRTAIIGGQYKEYLNLVLNNRYEEAQSLIVAPQCNNISEFKCCSFECWFQSELQAIINNINYAVYFDRDCTEDRKKLAKFREAFKPFKNRWSQYRQKWLSGS